MVGDILCDHSARTDKSIITNSMAADDGAIGPQRGTFLDEGGTDLVHLPDLGAGVVDICEDHGGAAKYAVFKGDAFINTDVILNFALVTNSDIGADDDVLANVAVLADLGTGKDVGEMPDFRSGTYFATFID